ncbi:hypothetical protein VHN57_15185 [Sphingobium sp. WW5]|uniref:Uncharacterized protein n=1 Tax=Sphingobium yanoikuyae TaxID=13690 RepID=A0A6M4G1B6_SPHYA|nr:hypothetical protein [Sphingobium yanoikuyae]QJR01031.1 hypothetical protein HH800_01750 [Sphingobium yanoikuyae]
METDRISFSEVITEASRFHNDLAIAIQNIAAEATNHWCAPIQDALALGKIELERSLQSRFPSEKRPAVYKIAIRGEEPHRTYKAFEKGRETPRIRAFARFPASFVPSETLYVGSSRSLVKRLLEHMGHGAEKTYALHMRHWATDIDGELSISATFLPYEISKDVLCAVEDALARNARPMFGRRGSV